MGIGVLLNIPHRAGAYFNSCPYLLAPFLHLGTVRLGDLEDFPSVIPHKAETITAKLLGLTEFLVFNFCSKSIHDACMNVAWVPHVIRILFHKHFIPVVPVRLIRRSLRPRALCPTRTNQFKRYLFCRQLSLSGI